MVKFPEMLAATCILLLCITNFGISKFLNKFGIEVETVMACPDNDAMESPLRNLTYVHLNRTHKSLSYDVTYRHPFDEKVGLSIMVDKWLDGVWKRIPFVPVQPNLCKYALKYFKDIWLSYQKALGVKRPEHCPIAPGNYSMKNYVFDLSSATSIPFWGGRYRFTIMTMNVENKRNISCLIMIERFFETY